MIIAIDIGNTRLKWGIHDGSTWLARGALATAELASLPSVLATWPRGARIVLCNVAGDEVERVVERALEASASSGQSGATFLRFRPEAEACGVRNAYANPGQLGADRWAALLGARALFAGECLVVCAGTATTIDHLDAQGVFRGGLILPGFDLMRSSLAGNTAQLPLAEGQFKAEPDNTMDAIISGCLSAQLGAIERRYAAIAEQSSTPACCVLTGGAAPLLEPHLRVPVHFEESLILFGLVRYAESI